jgi:hypothetical protein
MRAPASASFRVIPFMLLAPKLSECTGQGGMATAATARVKGNKSQYGDTPAIPTTATPDIGIYSARSINKC